MRAFACPVCGRLVSFESTACVHCHSDLGFDWDARIVRALDADPRCANHQRADCTGVVRREGELCWACELTRTRPHDTDAEGLEAFKVAEAAKRRLLFELKELGLPVARQQTEGDGGLVFDLLSSTYEPVTTGHADGTITLDLAEADDAHREQVRTDMGEPYRTLLGHLRHEVGHYYEPILAPPGSEAETKKRDLMGDERASYQEALDRHYEHGAPDDWPERFVSAYATMHPWEDWAETFAHVLHIRDTVQTAASHGLRVDGPPIETSDPAPLTSDPQQAATGDTQQLLQAWVPLAITLNALGRSLGHDDLYPFVLAPEAQDKLALVDGLVHAARQDG